MMKKYRIVEIDTGDCKIYEIQKKSFFGWWYNPNNIDAYETGIFETLEEAKKCIKEKMHRNKKMVVWTNVGKRS